jgi:hypothetical protein
MGNEDPGHSVALARFRDAWKHVENGEMRLPCGQIHHYTLPFDQIMGPEKQVEHGCWEVDIRVFWLPEKRWGHVRTTYGDGTWPVIKDDAPSSCHAAEG